MSNRIAIGSFSDGSIGLRASKPKYDASDMSLTKDKLIFDSAWKSLLPIYMTGTMSVRQNSTSTKNFSERLKYIPFFSYLSHDSGDGNDNYFKPGPQWLSAWNCATQYFRYNPYPPGTGGTPDVGPYVQVFVSNSSISIYYGVDTGSTQPPGSIFIAFVIYRIGA